MSFVNIVVTGIIDRSFPVWVSFELVDATGEVHAFHEKSAIIGADIDEKTAIFPFAMKLECTVIDITQDSVLIDTGDPLGIETISGETRFYVPDSAISEKDY